jgi:hypothetical protein
MVQKVFTIKNKMWLWPSAQAAWHFMYVDGKVKDNIRKIAKPHHMGMVRVRAKLGETSWETSLFPHKKEDCFIMPIKKSVRQAEGVFDGDEVVVVLELI